MNIKSLGVALICLLAANVAQAQAIRNAVPDVARPLPLSAVRVTGGPLKRAQDLNAEYLLKLEPDRMMAYYRKRAGLACWDVSGVVRGNGFRMSCRWIRASGCRSS